MATETIPDRMARSLEKLLDGLRAQIRRYIWVEGLARCLITLVAALWVSMAIDWLFEPPPWLRAVIVGIGIALVVYQAVLMLMKLAVRMPPRSMAILLERRFPHFKDSLITAVELSTEPDLREGIDPDLLESTWQTAAERAQGVRAADVLDHSPRARKVTLAVMLVAMTAFIALATPITLRVWAQRNLLLANVEWPRRTRLVIDGFRDGTIKVARGANLDLSVKADTQAQVPQRVEIRYHTEDGARGRVNMARDGNALKGRDRYQHYTHTFRALLVPMSFDVVGGDDRLRNLLVEVVESPAIVSMLARCEFPDYIGRPAGDIPVSGTIALPAGAKVTLLAKTNKDLVSVEVGQAVDTTKTEKITIPREAADRRAFEYELGALEADRLLLFSLDDTDGIRNQEPVRLNLTVIADKPPAIRVQPQGVGPAITPLARIPLKGKVTDDYGLGRVWFECIVDEQAPVTIEASSQVARRDDVELSDILDASSLNLAAGQKLQLTIKATDECNLGDEPNAASGEAFRWDIVTPDELRMALESRELNLRRRLESIREEVEQTRQGLLQLGRSEVPSKQADGAQPAADPNATRPDETAARATAGSQDESGEGPQDLDRLRVVRAMQASRKNADETLGVARGFDAIYDELVNNGINTEELKIRIKDGIAAPLDEIARIEFNVLDEQLQQLESQITAPEGRETLAMAQSTAQRIVAEMDKVLHKMLELENFNEVVARFRGIIETQVQLNQEVQERRKQQTRKLLEE